MPATATKKSKFDLDQIREFWTEQANQHGSSHAASWSDRPVMDMEIEEIGGFLNSGDHVLDIGCANGYSTVQFASQHDIRIDGLDYIPEMIQQAQQRLAEFDSMLSDRIRFEVGDITNLDVPSDTYDATVVIRVVINLGSWENQRAGLLEAARTVRPGGLLLLSEATVQGHEKLNCFRGEWGLPPIPEPEFNLYLDERQVQESLEDQLELVQIANFASSYYVGTRVLKPLLAQLTGHEGEIANPDMHWNRWFASLPAAGDYGTQKLFVFRRR